MTNRRVGQRVQLLASGGYQRFSGGEVGVITSVSNGGSGAQILIDGQTETFYFTGGEFKAYNGLATGLKIMPEIGQVWYGNAVGNKYTITDVKPGELNGIYMRNHTQHMDVVSDWATFHERHTHESQREVETEPRKPQVGDVLTDSEKLAKLQSKFDAMSETVTALRGLVSEHDDFIDGIKQLGR